MTSPQARTEAEHPTSAPDHDDHKRVFVIFNPVSGQSDPEQRKTIISEALARHGYTSQFIVTSKATTARALAAQAVRESVALVAVSGGDGTVMEAMAGLVGTDIPIAVLPAGTGNLLSINLGIPMTVPDAVDVALGGHAVALDLARTEDGRYFAIMGGMGLDAQVIADTDRETKKRLGVLAYFWAALKNLRRRPARVWITLDGGRPRRRRAKTVMIANMGRITGGVEAVPTASPHDGLLDVVIVRTASLGQWLRLVVYALIGRTQDDPTFHIQQARHIAIRAHRPEPVQFDGEEAGHAQELTVEVVPNAVRVLVPQTAPALLVPQPPSAPAIRMSRQSLLPILAALALGIAWGIRAWRRK